MCVTSVLGIHDFVRASLVGVADRVCLRQCEDGTSQIWIWVPALIEPNSYSSRFPFKTNRVLTGLQQIAWRSAGRQPEVLVDA